MATRLTLAVNAIKHWYTWSNHQCFADESKLLVLCDVGDNTSYRVRNWKLQLQHFVDIYGIDVMVCHYPNWADFLR